ncbi:hypothetical protein D9M69_715380 [compost metagenome]
MTGPPVRASAADCVPLGNVVPAVPVLVKTLRVAQAGIEDVQLIVLDTPLVVTGRAVSWPVHTPET